MEPREENGVIIPPRQPGHVEVRELMEGIRSAIRQKRASGIYLDQKLDRETDLELESLAERTGVEAALGGEIAADEGSWNVRPDYPISTHRSGPASAVVWIKRLLRPLVRLYTDFLVHRQAQINVYTVRGLRSLVRDLVLLRRDCRELRHKCRMLERELDQLRQRVGPAEAEPAAPERAGAGDEEPSRELAAAGEKRR